MATRVWRHSSFTAVAAVWSGTIASNANGHTFIVTLTDDNGDTASVSVVGDGTKTAATLAGEFAAAWNASNNPQIRAVQASSTGATITLQARTAGVPFSAAHSGSGTWSGTGYTTLSAGREDYGLASNWSGDLVPSAGDDVVVPPGRVGLLYGLNQSSVAIGRFVVERTSASSIGRWDSGLLHYLRIDPDEVEIRGSGSLVAIDVGAANVSPYIEAYGAPSGSGLQNVYVKGSAIDTLEVVKGVVGVAVLQGETSAVDTLICGYIENLSSDVQLTVGAGVTLGTLIQSGGRCLLRCGATDVTVSRMAELRTEGSGAIGTMTVFGTAYPSSTGAITTLNVYGKVDFSRDSSARTVGSLHLYDGAHVVLNQGLTVTNLILPAVPGKAIIEYV